MLMLLALFGRERKPRVSRRDLWPWTKAWANRWWVVEAASADDARELIARAEGGDFDGRAPAPEGRIVDCGRHGPGGLTRADAPKVDPSLPTPNPANSRRGFRTGAAKARRSQHVHPRTR